MVETQLTLIWTGIVGFAVFMYVLMDGFDLGLGILFPFAPSDPDRDIMMNSVAPIWDFNETWLVLGGAGLFAAFPLAYAIVLPALYLPLLAMLIALIFRGVAFEFRFKANKSRFLWNIAFNLGSLVATFVQGVTLGALLLFHGVDKLTGGIDPIVGMVTARGNEGGWRVVFVEEHRHDHRDVGQVRPAAIGVI